MVNIQISALQIIEIDHISKVWGIKATDTNYKIENTLCTLNSK